MAANINGHSSRTFTEIKAIWIGYRARIWNKKFDNQIEITVSYYKLSRAQENEKKGEGAEKKFENTKILIDDSGMLSVHDDIKSTNKKKTHSDFITFQ